MSSLIFFSWNKKKNIFSVGTMISKSFKTADPRARPAGLGLVLLVSVR